MAADHIKRSNFALAGRLAASLAIAMAAGILQAAWMPPAHALSEIEREEMQPVPTAPSEAEPAPEKEIPFPDPILTPPPASGQPEAGEEDAPDEETDTTGRPDPDGPVPEIIYNLDRLPPPARRMRELIIEAAKSGEIERLRPLVGTGDSATQLSFGGADGDPIAFLKELSGDEEGQEILAILEEVLSAGYVHLEPGTPEELYVWPYFFGVPLDRLDARQRVELFKIVTAGDYEDMKTYGAYIFYRVGISPDGHWVFFVAGD